MTNKRTHVGRDMGRGRVAALTHLLTEKLVSTISRLTDWLTERGTHTG